MVKSIVKNCIDCNNKLGLHKNGNKHHFRCDKCWLEYMANYDKHKLKEKIKNE